MLRKALLIASIFILSSCVSTLQRLSEKENQLKQEGFYSSYLALEYLQYSRSLLEDGDYLNSEYFAKKGLDVARGFNVIPENPRYWGVAEIELEDLIMSQKRYEEISSDEVRALLPIQMAHLTFLYDCWVTKEIKPVFRYGDLNRCKDRFYKLIDEIEYFVENYGKIDNNEPKVEIIEPKFDRYLILFDFDRHKINSEAKKRLIKILNKIDKLDGNYSIVLVGNADRSGKNLYNEKLALERARVVKQYLISNGTPKDLIEVRVQGEEFPDLITSDKVRQQFNRTTQVYIINGRKSARDIPLPVLYNNAYRQEIIQERRKRGLR